MNNTLLFKYILQGYLGTKICPPNDNQLQMNYYLN